MAETTVIHANYNLILLERGKTGLCESYYRMFYAVGYVEEGTSTNFKIQAA
jgi:hypothetical protein